MSLWHYATNNAGSTWSPGQGVTQYSLPAGSLIAVTTEAQAQLTIRGAFTAKNLWCNCTAVNGTATFVDRKTGANGGCSISITTTGTKEDTTGTTSYADGDKHCLALTTGGSHTNAVSLMVWSLIFDDGGNNVADMISTSGTINSTTTPAYWCPGGGVTATQFTSEAAQQRKFHFAATLSNLQINIGASNTINNTQTFVSRKNGANGAMSISNASSTTGLKEDSTVGHTDSIASGDLWCAQFSVPGGTTGSCDAQLGTMVKCAATANCTGVSGSGNNVAWSSTYVSLTAFTPGASMGTESNAQAKARTTLILKNLWAYCPTFFSGPTTITLRANAANPSSGPSVSVSGTGLFEDLTNTYTPATTDLINFLLSGGTTQISTLGVQQGAGVSAPTQESFTATLSFTGAFGPTKTFKTFSATFSDAATLTKKYVKTSFTAALSFVGALVKGKFSIRSFTATLAFAGAFGPTRTFKVFTPSLSFVSAQTKKYVSSGFSAGLSFVGGTTKRVTKTAFTPTLSFVGNLAASKFFNRAFTASLSFSGALARSTGKAFAATLSFAGALTRRVSKALTAGLSFVGNLATSLISGGHLYTQSLTASLSFAGSLTRRYANAGFTATLSFAGTLVRSTRKNLTATLSFIGVITRATAKAAFTPVLSFAGSLIKKTVRGTFTAALSFSGALAVSKSFLRVLTASLSFSGALAVSKSFQRVLTATLSFSGALTRSTGKAFGATLSFAASLAKRISRSFSATLSFAGALVKATGHAAFTATLSFSGSLSTQVVHFFTRAFTATLSFSGALVRSRLVQRAFSAALSFSGAVSRRTGKNLSAALSFSTALSKRIGKSFSAALSFIGFLFRGGFFEIFAGQKTGSTLTVTNAGSMFYCTSAGSQLQVLTEPVTGSTLTLGKTGSNVSVTLAGSGITIQRTDDY